MKQMIKLSVILGVFVSICICQSIFVFAKTSENTNSQEVFFEDEHSIIEDMTRKDDVEKCIISSFVEYDNEQLPYLSYVIEETQRQTIENKLPHKIKVISNGLEKEIEAFWECDDDIERTSFDLYTFELVLDTNQFENQSGINPYIEIRIKNDNVEKENRYSTTAVGSTKTYTTGYFYLAINGGVNGNSKIQLKISRSSVPAWATLKASSTTWNVAIAGGTNNHNIKLKSTTIATKKDNNSQYIIYSIPVTYDMPAHYQWKSRSYDEPSFDARLNFREYAGVNAAGEYTDSGNGNHQTTTTTRNLNLQVSGFKCGTVTYQSTRYYNTTMTMTIYKAERTVTFTDGLGTTLKTQTLVDSSAATAPSNPSRIGHTFAKWDKSFNMVCSNITVNATWDLNKVQIAYHPNGGTVSQGGYGYNDYGWVTQNNVTYFHTVHYGEKDDLYNASTFGLTRSGYTFGGWLIGSRESTTVLDQDTQYESTVFYDQTNSNQNTSNKALVTCYLYAKWIANSYTNSIQHYSWGYTNNEGNNNTKKAFLLGSTSFDAKMDSHYNMNSSKAKTIPNGFELRQTFGTSAISGTWANYTMNTDVTQKASAMDYEYDYDPINYSLTYELAGGINSTLNPTSYNVLYGITFYEPVKVGYIFEGWYDGNEKITGINQGMNATFSSAEDLYMQLNKRTTGNKKIVAKWIPKVLDVVLPEQLNIYQQSNDINLLIDLLTIQNKTDEIVLIQDIQTKMDNGYTLVDDGTDFRTMKIDQKKLSLYYGRHNMKTDYTDCEEIEKLTNKDIRFSGQMGISSKKSVENIGNIHLSLKIKGQ